MTTKIHVAVDALGNPQKIMLTAGQRADVSQGEALTSNFDFAVLIADRAYNSQEIEKMVLAKKASFCCPSKNNSLQIRDYDKHIYKDRNLVERFFNLLKHFRRIATRYEKTARNYLAMIHFAASIILLR